jgi:hypothetical protein
MNTAKLLRYAAIVGILTATSQGVETFSSTTSFQIHPLYFHWSDTTFPGSQFTLPSASTTIEIDTVTQQIRAFGFMPATTLTSNVGSSQNSIIGYTTPGFPNPPIPVPIYRSASLNLGISVAVPAFGFDTGVQTYQWNGSSYAFTSPLSLSFLAEVTINQTLTTGSEVFTDTFSDQLYFSLSDSEWLINTSGYPASLGVIPNKDIFTPPTEYDLANFTAANGFVHDLTFIPEPTTGLVVMLSLGLLSVRRVRRSA